MNDTYKTLKEFIEAQAKYIRKPLAITKPIAQELRGQELSEAHLNKVLSKVNTEMKQYLNRIFTRQAIHEIALQVINDAKQTRFTELDRFMELHRLLLPFDIPDGSENLHGLLITQKKQVLQLIEELPSGSDLQTETIEADDDVDEEVAELLQRYDAKVKALKEKSRDLAMLEQKLEYYDGWHRTIEKIARTDHGPPGEELGRANKLVEELEIKLQNPEKLAKLKECLDV